MAKKVVSVTPDNFGVDAAQSGERVKTIDEVLETAPVFGDKMHVSLKRGQERISQQILATTIQQAREGINACLGQGWQLA